MTHLLHIFGLVTLAHHTISQISASMYDVERINKHVKTSCGVIQATMKQNCIITLNRLKDMTEKVLFPVQYCPRSDANFFLMTCNFSQGATLENEVHKNITLKKMMNWMC